MSAAGGIVLWSAGGLLIALPLLWAPMSLRLPLGGDQGVLAWVGEVILSGGLPYADAWEVKGPGAHFLYALALALFGRSELAIRAFDLLMLAAAAAAFVRLGRLGGSRLAGLIGFGLAFALMGGSFWMAGQPDAWAGTLLLWIVVILLGRRRAAGLILASGLLLGAAVLIKPPYALFALAHVARAWAMPRGGRARLLGLAAAGALLPIGACALAYGAAGKLGSIWEVLVVFDLRTHLLAHGFLLSEVAGKILAVLAVKYLVLLPVAAVGTLSLWTRARPMAVALAGAAALAFVVAVVQNKFYEYQFMPFEIFAAALAGFGVRHVLEAASGREPGASLLSRGAMIVAAGVVVAVAVRPARHVEQMWRHGLGLMPQARWEGLFCGSVMLDFCYGDIAEAAALVREQTPAGAPIYLWGADALVYFLANRPSASRFGQSYPLIAAVDEDRQRMRAELMADLARAKPGFILVQTNDVSDLMAQPSSAYLDSFPALKDLIAQNYAEVLRNGTFIVYRAAGRS
jgi:4-amino-4-deoxy-L-arabinose transferase-like glycosyltransferase